MHIRSRETFYATWVCERTRTSSGSVSLPMADHPTLKITKIHTRSQLFWHIRTFLSHCRPFWIYFVNECHNAFLELFMWCLSRTYYRYNEVPKAAGKPHTNLHIRYTSTKWRLHWVLKQKLQHPPLHFLHLTPSLLHTANAQDQLSKYDNTL